MKKTIPWSITWFMAVMLLFSINSWAQLFETDFGVSTNWDPDNSETSYVTRAYSEGDWTFTGESSIRDAADTYNGSNYTFRNRGLFTVTNTGAVSMVDGFTLYIRDWSVTVDRTVRVSTNGGTDFTDIATINAGWFTNQVDYFPLTHNFASTTDLNANDLVIEITGVDDNTSRMRIGGFVVLGELPAYTTLFEFSNANGNLGDAAWFTNFRNFAADANNLYFGSPDGIEVVDRLTGQSTGQLNTTGIAGGWRSINDIEVSSDGLIFAANGILGVGDNFKVYLVSDDPLVAPVNVIDHDFSTIFTATRLGDKFTVVGSVDNGSLAIYAAESDGGSPARVVKWSISSAPGDPIAFGQPEVIEIVQKGSANQVTPLPNGNFYHTGAGISINKYDSEGTLLGSIPGGIVPTGSTAIKYIGMDGNDEMLAVYHYGAADGYLRLVRVVDGVAANAVLEFATPKLGPANSAGNGDVAFVPNADGMNVDLYVMDGSDGYGGYSTNNLNMEFPIYMAPPVFARAQIIHNSADAAAASVDVFVNGALFYGGLNFREATPFVDVPAGVDLTVDIAPAGDGIGASVFNLSGVQFTEGETYVIVASGIVSNTGYDPLTPFSLELYAGAREAASVATDVDLLVYHGATDAPGVNVDARYVGNVVPNAEYTDFAGYLNVSPAYYTLDIAAFAAPDDIIVSFGADLRALEGGAATVIASGFLDPSVNSDGAGFALLAVLADGTVVELPVAMDYEYNLSGLVEVPSNLSAGTGSGMLTLAGSVAQLSGSFSGLGSAYTMSHIHIAANGTGGGVAHALTATVDVDELGGSYDPFVNTFDFSADNLNQLTAGELYVNVHTTGFPPGEIRGQILSSPNTAPIASAITVPGEAAAITIEGDPATPFVPEWEAATDADGDLVAYVWQLAADDAFTTILVNASTGTATQFATDFETVDAILDGAGVAIGESITVYHRAVSTDGSAVTFGSASSVVLTRGEIAGFEITEFPWTETFEDDSPSRPEWTQIQEDGAGDWTFAAGSSGGSISTAYEGALNARFVSTSGDFTPVTKLVTPVLDLTSLSNPRISFYYGQEDWGGDQNELKAYYRIAPDQPWVEIAHLTSDIPEWTKYNFTLPEASSTYQVALEGINNWGRANVVDFFTVEESPTLFSVTFNVVDELAAPVADAVVTLNGNANAEGDYVFADIEPGTYNYSVMAPLFDPLEGEVIVVDADVTEDVTLIAGTPELVSNPEGPALIGFAVNGISSTSRIINVSNVGYAPAEIQDGDITITGINAADFAFALVDGALTYPITVQNGEGFDVEITYTPTSVVEASAELNVASNATADLITALTAVGYDPLTDFVDNFDMYEDGIELSQWQGIALTDGTGSFVDISSAGTPVSEPYHARLANGNNGSGDVILISPMVTDLDVSWVRFFARMSSSSQTEDLDVGYLTDPTDPATFVSIGVVTVTGSYEQHVVSFADVVDPMPANAYIALRHTFPATFRIYLVDEFVYEPVPITAILTPSLTEIDFGVSVYINEVSTQELVVSNTGVGTLTLNEADFTITGADAANFAVSFADDVVFPVELGTLETLALNVTFVPTAEVGYSASLDIEDNLTKAITSIALSGTGYDPTITPAFVYDFIGEDFPPMDWANLQGVLTDASELTPGTFWQPDEFANNDALPEQNSARINIYSARAGWMVTPPIDLGDGTTPYMLSFDMAITAWASADPGTLENKRVAVVISTDNGATWSDANILREWVEGDDISNTGQTEFIDLSAYNGIVKLGFYGESWTGGSDVDLFVTNVGVDEAVYQTVTFNIADVDANPITDASVNFNGEVLNAAPYTFDVVEGNYDYEVMKDGYLSQMGSVIVVDQPVDVDVTLELLNAVDFTVSDFDTNPVADAAISITGPVVADLLTAMDGTAMVDLPNGTYDVVVTAAGYLEKSLQIFVDGAPVSEAVTLTDNVVAPYGLLVDLAGTDALFSWNNVGEFMDSFEDGTFDAWFSLVEGEGTPGDGESASWYIDDADGGAAPDGTSVATVDWGYNIDTWLISPLTLVGETTSLSFQWNSSYYWSVDPNPNAELMVKVSPDGENWTEIWNWQTDAGVWENWTWYETILDLGEYAGQELHFAFQLVANDNANTELDAVSFGPASKAGTYLASLPPVGNISKDARMNTLPPASADKALLDYTVLLNGAEVATGVTDTEYQFTGLPYGTHTAGVAANYSTGTSDTVYTDFTIQLPMVDPVPMAMLYDATGANLPSQIGTGSNARAAALYQDRYVIVPSREGGAQVWAFDMINPHLDPMALDMGTDLIVGGLFAVNYVEVVGDDIYVSNMSLGSDAAHPFRVYRWSSLDAAPELVLSADGGWGRLGDAFTIIGDPAADGSIVAHINSDPGENALRRQFRKFDFVGGAIQNEDAPELVEVTLPEEVGTMNSYGVMKLIEGETDKYLVTSNAIGMAVVDGAGDNLAYIGTDVFPSRTMDANIFYFGGNRYLSFVVNKEWETLDGDFTAAYHQVVDITMGATVEEAISMISTPQDLINRTVHTAAIGDGSAFLGGTNRVVVSGDGDLMVLSHVVARGFKLVTSGAALTSYTLTVEAAPAEGGTATGGGDFFEGATASITAEPADGYQFVNWTVDGTEVTTDLEFDYTMPGQATTIVANFETIPVVDVATLAELRALPSDGSYYRYTGDAVIVAMDGFRNRKFLQDETAAIMIDDNGGTITTEYDLYDEITNVMGYTTVFRDLLQFVPQENTPESTVNTPVDPTVFTLDAVTQDDQAKLIKFENVTFSDLEADQVFANGTNYNITDGTNTFVVRTDFWNIDLIDMVIPTSAVNITGVVITFNETLQLVPRFAADIEVLYTLTLVANPAEGGTVIGEGSYAEGTVVSLNATAAEGYVFKDWTNAGGTVVSTDAGFDYTMPAEATTLTANFDIVDFVENLDATTNIYPNPARDNFIITTSAIIRTLVITDITGKVVYNDVVNDNQIRVQNQFETGIYILRIHTDEGVVVKKLQIQK